ncbi:dephospho-CoA kinase [Candidatus Woesearchaeota archaeon]|nr:dephospho-CoA kinase [Candidatus Woesearchaeota archaeon]
MIVAVTGKIGSGKTTVCNILKQQGAHVIHADHVGHQLLKAPEVKQKLKKTFGTHVFTKGKVDREKLGNLAFFSNAALHELNNIIHPHLRKAIQKQVQEKKKQKKLIVIDAALYKELKLGDLTDVTVLVRAKKRTLQKRNKKYPPHKFHRIFHTQHMPKADHVLENNGTKQALRKDVLTLYEVLLA